MMSSQILWRTGILLVIVGTAACGSVTPLGKDGGAGTGGSGGAGTGGADAAAGTGGPAGSGGGGGAKEDAAADATQADADYERAPECPATFTSLEAGSPCPVSSGKCDYPQGRCTCFPCANGGGGVPQATWACRAWDSGGDGCPPHSPAIGSACSTPDQFCTYGSFCGVSVGDDLKCEAGTWKKIPSPLGTCILRQCTAPPTDGGAADHPPDTCSQPSDCPGGACWQQLSGAKACFTPRAAPALGSCANGDPACCTKDGNCTQQSGGRCLPLLQVKENFCGGAVPLGNACRYDQCRTDADCKASAPAGAKVSACVPSGALDTWGATCVHGGCRTDADCVLHAGGRCQYGQAATNGQCVLRNVFFCAYPSDPCGTPEAKPCSTGQICVPNADYQGRQCGKAPPAYP